MLSGVSKHNYGGQTMTGCGRGAFVFARIKIIAWLWTVSAFATLAMSDHSFYTHGRYGKRGPPYDQAPLLSGSRYSRGDTTSPREPKSVPKLLEVSPRVDRFFLGSRYGKRTPNKNNNSDHLQQQQDLPSLSRISSLRQFEKALGYPNRVQGANNDGRRNDEAYDEIISKNNSNDKRHDEEIPIDILTDDEQFFKAVALFSHCGRFVKGEKQ